MFAKVWLIYYSVVSVVSQNNSTTLGAKVQLIHETYKALSDSHIQEAK